MYIADLHTHSRYSRATSKECTPEYLDLWARRKGIHLIGSGDFTHPAWREELKEKLKPAEDGFYVLKKDDFLRLVVLDDADKTVQQLQIDRDTMTSVTVLGLLGDRYEPVTQQICLGYAFGDGRQTSCEVTVEAVGNLLGGQTIDQYLAMGLDGISTLNDLAGGVTVTLEDDFSAIDPAMTKGTTLTLQGEQAETYVRSRRSVGVGTNEARMARQESYIRQLSVQLDEKLQKDQNFAVDAYDALQPYLTTSMAKGQLVNEAWAAKDYTRLDTIKPDGTYQVGEDGFMEFYPDADALQQAVLQLFYEKVE